jgi:agmatine/peptidylarginine deiminase
VSRRIEKLFCAKGAAKRAHVTNPNFCDCYINCYLADGGVVAAKYGDHDSDELAYRTLSQAYPDRKVVQIRVDTLSGGGGSIHCATQRKLLPVWLSGSLSPSAFKA